MKPKRTVDPDRAVALGAAAFAGILEGEVGDGSARSKVSSPFIKKCWKYCDFSSRFVDVEPSFAVAFFSAVSHEQACHHQRSSPTASSHLACLFALQVEGQEVMTSWQASIYRMMARDGMM